MSCTASCGGKAFCSASEKAELRQWYVVEQLRPGRSPMMWPSWQKGHSASERPTIGMSPKSQYATTREPGTSALTLAINSFVRPAGLAMNTPFLYLEAGTHSAPCGPTPAF